MVDEIFVDDDHTQRDVVTANYTAAAANISAVGSMLTKIPRSIDYGIAVELSQEVNVAAQRFHDAIGCLSLEVAIAKRLAENNEDRDLLHETRARLRESEPKGKKKRGRDR